MTSNMFQYETSNVMDIVWGPQRFSRSAPHTLCATFRKLFDACAISKQVRSLFNMLYYTIKRFYAARKSSVWIHIQTTLVLIAIPQMLCILYMSDVFALGECLTHFISLPDPASQFILFINGFYKRVGKNNTYSIIFVTRKWVIFIFFYFVNIL